MIEIIGIIGGLFYLSAYIEVALGKWNGKSFWYEINNIMGAVFLSYYSIHKSAYTSMVLNIIWGLIALYGIRHIIIRHAYRKQVRRKRRSS